MSVSIIYFNNNLYIEYTTKNLYDLQSNYKPIYPLGYLRKKTKKQNI
ncbi:hypothetical protein XBKB1_2230007 [Xenorhabdus bovienii str. kraussei Becker Underwood]|uniref:Uncharacterized protein n=1 Tax=Xenorhabdus bovienii str. kraussei Becker Underwood TaxID=1398204 RepID=A0A077PVR3_XENBV|nr:hypothetical protein XBKB1_2230007 [Xenorhabdus bovienii str. kraussei Becker Underwood]